jgi:hypothetical protein
MGAWNWNETTATCLDCGFSAAIDGVLPEGGIPHTCDSTEYKPQSRPGLGDLVAAGFARIGVTQERFSAWIGAECNCPERIAKLNAAGRYLKMRAAKLGIELPL